jgi:hypothetical protein
MKTSSISPVARLLELLIGLATGLIGLGLLIIPWIDFNLVEGLKVPETPFFIIFVAISGMGAFLAIVSFRLLANQGAFLMNDVALLGQLLITLCLLLLPLVIVPDAARVLAVCLFLPGTAEIELTFFAGLFFSDLCPT